MQLTGDAISEMKNFQKYPAKCLDGWSDMHQSQSANNTSKIPVHTMYSWLVKSPSRAGRYTGI